MSAKIYLVFSEGASGETLPSGSHVTLLGAELGAVEWSKIGRKVAWITHAETREHLATFRNGVKINLASHPNHQE